MKLQDLIICVDNFRNRHYTRRSINVYLNKHDYNLILADKGYDYNSTCNFIIYDIQLFKNIDLHNGCCYINSDAFSGKFDVLTEDERIIKNIIE